MESEPPKGNGVTVEIDGLHKSYGGVPVLRGIDLHVNAGDAAVIVGGSGEGKSVLLRQIAGLEIPDAGSITLGGIEAERYVSLAPARKSFRLAMVFQSSALLNSLSVFDNVGLRLREHGAAPDEIVAAVTRCLQQVGLEGQQEKLPAELSGGMRKRVAIARALAAEPQLILYDEPTADLDPIRTKEIGDLLLRIRMETGATQVVVTHDLVLAMTVGSHIAVIRGGRIVDQQLAGSLTASSHEHTQALLRAANLQ